MARSHVTIIIRFSYVVSSVHALDARLLAECFGHLEFVQTRKTYGFCIWSLSKLGKHMDFVAFFLTEHVLIFKNRSGCMTQFIVLKTALVRRRNCLLLYIMSFIFKAVGAIFYKNVLRWDIFFFF